VDDAERVANQSDFVFNCREQAKSLTQFDVRSSYQKAATATPIYRGLVQFRLLAPVRHQSKAAPARILPDHVFRNSLVPSPAPLPESKGRKSDPAVQHIAHPDI